MATSKGFFGIRRGSTKSHTYSELNGKQVTKDRVYTVRNPKTLLQMQQRLCVGQAGQAYKAFREIVDHSFEGKASPSQNYNYFMSRNIDICKSLYKEGKGIAFDTYIPAAKNFNYFSLFRVFLSEGSLSLNASFNGTVMDTESAMLMETVFNGGNESNLTLDSTVNDFCNAFGVDKGDQLTFLFVVEDNVKSLVAQVYKENPVDVITQELTIKNVAPNRVYIGRVVIGDNGERKIFKKFGSSSVLYTFDEMALNQSKSKNYSNICFDFSSPIAIGLANLGASNSDNVMGGCIIRSKYTNGWRRSTTYLTLNDSYCATSPLFDTYPVGGWGVGTDTSYLNNAVK